MKKIVIRFNAPVILTFALLSLLALLLGNWTDGAATYQYFSVYRSSLSDPLTYVRFFGHVLGHADYEHYMSNMLLILLVGPGLEEKYGSGTMVWTIAVTALVTGLVHFVFFPGSVLLGGYRQQEPPVHPTDEPAFTPDPNDWLVVDEIGPDGDCEYHLFPTEEKGV